MVLQEGSSIALFSCYRHPDRVSTPRKLVVVEKERGGVVTFLHADSLRIRATQARRHSPTPPPLRPP